MNAQIMTNLLIKINSIRLIVGHQLKLLKIYSIWYFFYVYDDENDTKTRILKFNEQFDFLKL